MANHVRTYQRKIHKELGFMATWLPGDEVKPGDIGLFSDGQFRRVTNLASLKIEAAMENAGSPQNLHCKSTSGTTISLSGDAEAISGTAKSSMHIDFTQKGSFLFTVEKARKRRLSDMKDVGDAVLERFEQKEWDRDWYLIEEVYKAVAVTVIICHGGSGSLTLSSEIDLGALGITGLSNPEANLQIMRESGDLFVALGIRSATPLYRCVKVNPSFFGNAKLERVREAARDGRLLQRAPLNALLDS